MPVTALPIVTITDRNPDPTDVDAWVWTEADEINGNSYRSTGRETLLVRNTGAVSRVLTITSVDDLLGRSENVVRTLTAGQQLAYELGVDGWRQTDGYVLLTADHDDIEFAVIRRPSR